MMTDEDFAKKLQEEFNREANIIELQNEKDAKLAQKLARDSHDISDSDTDDDPFQNNTDDQCQTVESEIFNDEESEENIVLKRPLCKYGSNCYRKNPIHVKEFYHPSPSEESSSSSQELTSKKRKMTSHETNDPKNIYRKDFDQRLDLSHPLRFFLNKIFELPETHKDWQTLVFPDLLNPKLGTLIESAQLNFMIDLDFVMKFYNNSQAAKTPVLFMYGILEGRASDFEGVTCVKVNMPFQYGVHHTKMMLLHYKEGLRVVVHTANLISDDWNEKTQGFWVSPLFPPLANGQQSLLEGESGTSFKRDLTDYLLFYKSPDLVRWSHIVKGHDFTSCKVYFIGSVPGYHVGENRFKFGHLKCRQLLRKKSKWKNASSPVIIQCSSIGTLGKDAKTWLSSELAVSLAGGSDTSNIPVKLIYPSEEDVRNSFQGYGGGSCLPYNSHIHHKQEWLAQHLHLWRSDIRRRSRSMPHIKTYTRLSKDLKEAQYFLLTSSNLSKAAWGQLQKQGTQLFIRSYEAGILWLPEVVIEENSFRLASNTKEEGQLPLPYDVPLTPYPANGVPWFMNTNKTTPDILGNKYP